MAKSAFNLLNDIPVPPIGGQDLYGPPNDPNLDAPLYGPPPDPSPTPLYGSPDPVSGPINNGADFSSDSFLDLIANIQSNPQDYMLPIVMFVTFFLFIVGVATYLAHADIRRKHRVASFAPAYPPPKPETAISNPGGDFPPQQPNARLL